jgi:hypothetical protein
MKACVAKRRVDLSPGRRSAARRRGRSDGAAALRVGVAGREQSRRRSRELLLILINSHRACDKYI